MKHWSLLALSLASAALLAETCPTPKVEKSQPEPKAQPCPKPETVIEAKPALSSVKPLRVEEVKKEGCDICTLSKNNTIHFQVVGQGVAPVNTVSPAQAMALAKRAAIADAYRQLGEKICGVRVEGRDLIRNMMISRSTVRTQIDAMIRNARILDTKFKDGLCEVEMEVTLNGKEWYARLSR
ncbi:LPP20 family lipoprotein [Hydrogenimonas sp.]